MCSQVNILQDGAPPIVTTQPDRILRHSISDEELDMLCESRSDFVQEIALFAAGAVLGTAPSALTSMFMYFKNPSIVVLNLGLSDFIQILIFWASLVLAICVGVIFYNKSNRSASLREQIRNRTNRKFGKDPVTNAE